MITITNLTKSYGSTVAVDDLSFEVKPGQITGFLGPNGSGKSTTMRMLLGLDRPDAGTATINGKEYRNFPAPAHEVGSLLDAKTVFGKRKARTHLAWIAQASGIGPDRVDHVLDLVGLQSVANKDIGEFSLGMSQRLGIAVALLGDPPVLIFDEPVNGLDPEGIRWFRKLMKQLSGEGRTILVSSHLMSEMQATADHVIVIGKGKLVADAPMASLMAGSNTIRFRSPHLDRFQPVLQSANVRVSPLGPDLALLDGIDLSALGDLALKHQVAIHELAPERSTLEDAYMQLTSDSAQYTADSTQFIV